MSEDYQPGELMRAIQALRGELRDMRADVNARLDKLVSSEMFAAEQRRVEGRFHEVDNRIKGVDEDLREEVANRKHAIESLAKTARWAIGLALSMTATLVAVAGLLLNRGIS